MEFYIVANKRADFYPEIVHLTEYISITDCIVGIANKKNHMYKKLEFSVLQKSYELLA